jgi:nicotinate-nucleotide adenylyltransferase
MPAVGVFGGSFDPPHLAHLALARAALGELALERVLWVPAGQPWQKTGRALAPAVHRVAMVKLLIAGEPRFEIDERELHRTGPSYTLDTLRELQGQQPGTAWWLILGQDQLARFETWHGWREILALAGLAVAARGEESVRESAGLAGCPHALRVLPMPALTHSATEARTRSAAGADLDALVGEPVARYIARHRMYRGA